MDKTEVKSERHFRYYNVVNMLLRNNEQIKVPVNFLRILTIYLYLGIMISGLIFLLIHKT